MVPLRQRQQTVLLYIILAMMSASSTVSAQDWRGWSVEPSLDLGVIYKHTPKFLPDPGGLSTATSLHFSKQTFGDKDWHQQAHFPHWGFGFTAFRFGNREQFGNAYASYVTLNLPLWQRKQFELNLRVAMGVAWLDKPYDPATNRENNVIGSHFNNTTHFRLGGIYQATPKLAVLAAGQFTHYSNGSTSLPNLGINVLSANIGLRYTPQPVLSEDFTRDAQVKPSRLWGAEIQGYIASRQTEAPGSANYPIYTISAAGYRTWRNINRVFLGLEYEYNTVSSAFFEHVNTDFTDKEKRDAAKRYMIYAAHETRLGRIGLYAAIGTYLNDGYLLPGSVYNRYGLRLYIPVGRANVVLGATFKTHLIDAEMFAVSFGAQF